MFPEFWWRIVMAQRLLRRSRLRPIPFAVLTTALIAGMLAIAGGLVSGAPGDPTSGNFVATGHDLDLHCASGTDLSCDYMKIVVDRVRAGSTLPILALDEGTQVA